MYVNKCIKCGREFETKNPKRVICPDCLYPDKKMMVSPSSNTETTPAEEPLKGYSAGGTDEPPRFYSAGGSPEPRYNRPQRQYNNNRQNYNRQNNYNNRNQQGGYNRSNNNYNRQGGGNYNRPQRPYNNQGGFQNRRPQNNRNNFNKRPAAKKAPKQLLVSKEQLELIEKLYKAMLPLPNPDCHEVIGEKSCETKNDASEIAFPEKKISNFSGSAFCY